MRFLTFKKDGDFKLGLKSDEQVVDVQAASSRIGVEIPCTYDALV